MFGRSERGAVENTFASLSRGHAASAAPTPAPASRGRWADVHLAVLYACDDTEMAVVSRTEHDWGWQYRVRTVEDWPGTLTIHRIESDQVYEATAIIGVFNDRAERADSLITAFEKHMAEFGRKKQFPDEPEH